jgi:hypothetical protein
MVQISTIMGRERQSETAGFLPKKTTWKKDGTQTGRLP